MPDTKEKMRSRDQLLDHFIEAALEAIKRGRATWLLGISIVFIFGVTVFNATLSWNDKQIERRASLYSAAVGGHDSVRFLTEVDLSINDALTQGTGELGYLRPLWTAAKTKQDAFKTSSFLANANEAEAKEAMQRPADEAKKAVQRLDEAKKAMQRSADEADEAMKELKSAAFSDLKAHLERRNAFDTVSLPLIGVAVTGSDYGIIGGIALIIVGYWLLAMLRRELLVLSEFVTINYDGHLIKGSSNYESADLIYACHRIKHYMVFSTPEPGSWLSYVTTASFFAAPFLLILNHFLTVNHIYIKHLGTYWQWHVVVEGLIVLLSVAVWGKGWLYQHRSMQLMQFWEIECGKNNPFPSE